MPDIFGASGQFSIGALGQQNQDAFNNAYGSGGFGGTVGQYAPYPMFGEASPGPAAAPQPSVFNTGAAPFNTYGVSPEAWASMSPSDMATFNQKMGASGASPSGPMQSPNMQNLLGYNPNLGVQNGFGYPGAMPPSQMFNPSLYAPRANPFAFRAGLSMDPYMSLGWPGPRDVPDPTFDQMPERGTQDWNVLSPDYLPGMQQQPQDPASVQRDAVAKVLMESAQQARS
jgi:hypothetical protein